MRRIGTFFIAVIFVCNSCAVVSASPEAYTKSRGGVHLAPPLLLDDMGEETPDHKNVALAEIALQMELHELAERAAIENEVNLRAIREAFEKALRVKEPEATHEDTVHAPARIKAYYRQIEPVSGTIFAVPVSVQRGGERDNNYWMLFSTARNEDGMFPAVVCTADQRARYQVEIAQRGVSPRALPLRQPVDDLAVERYKEHEAVLDAWIKDKMRRGLYAIGADWREAAPDLYGGTRFVMSGDVQNGFIDRTADLLAKLGIMPAAVQGLKQALAGKPVILLRRDEGEPLPEIRAMTDAWTFERHGVRAHSSDAAVYLIVDAADFDGMIVPAEKAGRAQAGVIDIDRTTSANRREIEERYLFESGAHLGLLGSVDERKRLANAVTRAAVLYESDPDGYRPSPLLATLEPVVLSSATRVRDYAAAEAPGRDPVLEERLRAIISPDRPVTLRQMIRLLRDKGVAEAGSIRTVGDTLVLWLETGWQLQFDLSLIGHIREILAEKELLLDREPAPVSRREVEPLAVILSVRRAIEGRQLTPDELFARVYEVLRDEHPDLAARMERFRAIVNEHPETIAKRLSEATGWDDNLKRELPVLRGIDRRIAQLAFYLGESVESGSRYARTPVPAAPTGEEAAAEAARERRALEERIRTIWETGGRYAREEPFTELAQSSYRRINYEVKRLRGFDRSLSPEAWIAISYARLFGRGDVAAVLAFFEFVKETRRDDRAFYDAVMKSHEAIALYLAARAMDPASVDMLPSITGDYFEHYLAEAFGDDMQAYDQTMEGRFGERAALRAWDLFLKTMLGFRYNRYFDRALTLIDNGIRILGSTMQEGDDQGADWQENMDTMDYLQDAHNDTVRARDAAIAAASATNGPAVTEAVREIDKAWGVGTEVVDRATPFTEDAQRYCRTALPLARRLGEAKSPSIQYETWYRGCYARLYGDGDFRHVIAFFESAAAQKDAFFERLAADHRFITMYLVARLMDRDSLEDVRQGGRSLFAHFLEKFYGRRIDEIESRYRKTYIDNVITTAVNYTYRMVMWRLKERRYDEALTIADDLIEYLEHEKDMPGSSFVAEKLELAREARQLIEEAITLYGRASEAVTLPPATIPTAGSVPEASLDPLRSLAAALAGVGFDPGDLSGVLGRAGVDGEAVSLDEKGALVFSERVTFDNQFGAYLPLIRNTGMRIVVIAPKPEQQELIARLNEGQSEKEKILTAPDLDGVTIALRGVSRFYYFMVAGDDPGSGRRGVTAFDLTSYLKQIIASLKAICRLSDDDATALDKVMERFRAVSEAA